MLIVGVDPGTITGLFWVDLDGQLYQGPQHSQLTKFNTGMALDMVLKQYYAQYNSVDSTNVLIGCEKYIITANSAKTNQPDALKVTGIVEYVCETTGTVPVHAVIKANAMKIASNQRLRDVGWWKVGGTHSNDAARVALATLAQHRPGVFSRLPGVIQL